MVLSKWGFRQQFLGAEVSKIEDLLQDHERPPSPGPLCRTLCTFDIWFPVVWLTL